MTEKALYKIALSKAMLLCSKREYCIGDIRLKLHSWNVNESDTDKILDSLLKDKFIDESRYSAAFVKDRFIYNKWGKVKISAHLKAKKIPSTKIENALNTIDNEVYIKTIKDLIHSHATRVKAKNNFDMKGKLLRYGLSKGFETELLYDILNETW